MMSETITLSAVGDVMMWREQVAAVKLPSSRGYDFDRVFRGVKPIFRKSDLVIGNLETVFAGPDVAHQLRNAKNGFPRFSCPDELAAALKKAGFHVLTTANNHCMDHGFAGVKRTLDVLDRFGLKHTGTARSLGEAKRLLVVPVKGVNVAILAYTYGTNGISPPASKRWAVNLMRAGTIKTDIMRARREADLVVVAVHFGREFRRYPTERQVGFVTQLLKAGADVVLGSHPHVVQPAVVTRVRRPDGKLHKCAAIFSLGNFVSRRMWNNQRTEQGVIMQIKVEKDQVGRVQLKSVEFIPTLTKAKSEDQPVYAVVPQTKSRASYSEVYRHLKAVPLDRTVRRAARPSAG